MTSFIQSRGRARKPGSKFYVFIDSEDTKSTLDLENQESILRHLIEVEGTRDYLPSEKSKEIIKKLNRELPPRVCDVSVKKPVEEGMNTMLRYMFTVFSFPFALSFVQNN